MYKDYLTTKEAADYMCVSVRRFYQIKKAVDLRPINSFGKLLYKREHLKYIIEHSDQYTHSLNI